MGKKDDNGKTRNKGKTMRIKGKTRRRREDKENKEKISTTMEEKEKKGNIRMMMDVQGEQKECKYNKKEGTQVEQGKGLHFYMTVNS